MHKIDCNTVDDLYWSVRSRAYFPTNSEPEETQQ